MTLIRKPILYLDGRRFGPVVFYRLPCGLICRALNPHTRKRILKDPRFAEFRKCSKRMAKASKIGSAVYTALPEDFRQLWMYRAFVGEAMKMLKEGMTGEKALESLFKTYAEVWYIKAETKGTEQNEMGSTGSVKRSKPVELNIRRKKYNATARSFNFGMASHANIFQKSTADRPARSSGMGPPMFLQESA